MRLLPFGICPVINGESHRTSLERPNCPRTGNSDISERVDCEKGGNPRRIRSVCLSKKRCLKLSCGPIRKSGRALASQCIKREFKDATDERGSTQCPYIRYPH